MSLRIRLVIAGAAGCLLLTALRGVLPQWLEVSAAYPWKAGAIVLTVMTMAMVFANEHPYPRLGAANQVTIVRAFLVALVGGLIGESHTPAVAAAAVAATIVIAVMDGVDGWLARRSRMTSTFGGRFDMETDALLVMVLSVLVWRHGKAGAWILAAGFLRYAFVAAGWLLPWMAAPLTPTFRAKTIAVLSLVGLGFALLPSVAPTVSELVAAITLVALTWSFAVDVGRLWRAR